jgi:tetratricopeptide (TPR) repeat protein
MGNLEKAESFYMEAINIRRQVLGNTHSDYGMSTANLANVYADLGIYEKAQLLYEEALVILEKIPEKKMPITPSP